MTGLKWAIKYLFITVTNSENVTLSDLTINRSSCHGFSVDRWVLFHPENPNRQRPRGSTDSGRH